MLCFMVCAYYLSVFLNLLYTMDPLIPKILNFLTPYAQFIVTFKSEKNEP